MEKVSKYGLRRLVLPFVRIPFKTFCTPGLPWETPHLHCKPKLFFAPSSHLGDWVGAIEKRHGVCVVVRNYVGLVNAEN